MSISTCLAAAEKIDASDIDRLFEIMGDSPSPSEQAKAIDTLIGELMDERAAVRGAADLTWSPTFTLPSEWSEEAFAGPMLSRRPETTRGAMTAVLAARNKTLRRVNPASILEADISRADRALRLVVDEIAAGRYEQTEIPLGPVPHVLHMLGAPMQMMQMNASIVRKVLVEKHSRDFAGATPRELVEGIYKPVMVAQARAAGEFEVTTPLRNDAGVPITAIIKVNTETLPGEGGKTTKVASVMSAYARPLVGRDSLLERALTGKVLYANLWEAQALVSNPAAQSASSRSTQPPGVSVAAGRQLVDALTRAVGERRIRDDVALLRFIGDTYRAENSPAGWDDAPAFSAREDIVDVADFDLMADPGGRPQTETAAFKRWFGDSKVVNRSGKPAVVYHGTPKSFDVFDIRKASWDNLLGQGFYFSTTARGAEQHADDGAGGDNIMPVYLSIKRPATQQQALEVLDSLDEEGGPYDPTATYEEGQRVRREAEARGENGAEALGAFYRSLKKPAKKKPKKTDFRDAMESAGFDGIKARGVWVAFRPEQIKSAIGNVGLFDPNNPDIRYSRRPQQGRFNLRNFNIGHQFIESIQDRYNRWLQATQDIAEQGGTITEENDFYRAEERYWGLVGAQTEDFAEEVRQFVEAVAADKLMLEDVALYAYAQHAPERNAWIAAQRATMPDGGSGMLTQDALDLLDEARQAGLEPALQQHAATLRRWIQGTRDTLFNGGLIDQDEYDAWTNMFASYVPLRGLDGAPEARGTGQGFNIRGREGKAAMGRKSQAKQIIEQIVQDRTRALIRVGKNDVVRSFGQFVLDNPSPNLWEINAVENKPISSVDANGNRIIEERQQVITDDRTITFKDGGKEVHVLVHDEKLLEQLKNLNADNPSRVVGAFLFVNKILARLYTSLNPVFTVINAARDVQAAAVGTIDEIGFMAVPRLLANLPQALVESYRAEAGNFSPDYSDFRNTGGKTGFFNFRDLDAQTEELQALLRNAERSVLDPRKVGPAALSLIESINSGIENGIRLATFKTARQTGSSLADAARISKNITVNFNRRGTMTPTLSAYFLFFNPAVQGTARIVQALSNPKVLATLGAGMVGVAALALRNAGMGEDDDGVAWWDKIPSEVKERNLVIVLPPGASGGEQINGSQIGRYVKIPMPYGYNFFAVVANQVVDVWRNMADPRRGSKPVDAAAKAFTAFMGAWVPVQELGRSFETPASAALAAVPDALNPLAQVAINLSSFGRPLYPDDPQSRNAPDSSKYFASQAGTIFQRAAESLNEVTGGDRYRSGLLDVTPAALETIARSYGGGPATFAIDLVNALYLRQNIERATPRYEALPFVKQLYGVIDAETDRMVGYQRLEQAAKIVDPMLRARREGGPAAREAMADMREELGSMLRLADTIESTRQALSDVRKKELKIMSSDKPEAIKYVELMEQAQKRRLVLQKFNAAYDRALLRQDEAQRQGREQPPQ